MERSDLPISADYWPVVPGERLSSTTAQLYEVPENVCYDGRNNWVCTRRRDHELPHVAMSGFTVVGVWDQQWYGDRSARRPQSIITTAHYPQTRS
jgi:hypothetical protein